jgi:HK97 family phage major capsid protein
MSMKQTLKEKAAELKKHHGEYVALYGQLEEKTKKNEAVTPEERSKLDNMEQAGTKMRAEVERLKNIIETDELLDGASGERQAKDSGRPARVQSKGTQFIESEQYKAAVAAKSETTEKVQVKELYGQTGAGTPVPVYSDRIQEIFTMPQQPTGIRDLINVSETSSNSIDYIKQSVRTNNAGIVPERNADNSNYGLKPESNLELTEESTAVKTIAHWVRASRTILQDAPRLRDMIDNELPYMGDVIEEQQIVRGSGAGTTNLLGIINSTGIQLRVHKVSGRDFSAQDKIADTIRKGLTDITLAFYKGAGVAIAVSPQTMERMELEKDGQGRYLNVFDPVRLQVWRRPVVESFALLNGEAIVGDFKRGATLWDRMESEIRVSENVNDDFIRNALRVLEERRLAFAVIYGDALEYITALNT